VTKNQPPWAAPGDVNAFFGLMLDNIADLLLTVGHRAEKIAAAAKKAGYPVDRCQCFASAQDAGIYLRGALARRTETVVLFKGSRGMALEKAIAEFGHE